MDSPLLRSLRDRELMRTIFHLAWPTVMEQALQTVVQYVDTAQVGRIGANASAAVGLTSTTTWLVNAPLWAAAMGVLSCVSRALGADDKSKRSSPRPCCSGRRASSLPPSCGPQAIPERQWWSTF